MPITWQWPKSLYCYFNSASGKKQADSMGITYKEGRVIHSGLSVEEFPFVLKSPSFEKTVRIVVPGRIARIKAIDRAIVTAKQLQILLPEKQVLLDIIGPVTEPTYSEELSALIDKLGMSNNVRFIGQIDHNQLVNYYSEAGFCFFTSKQQSGFSRVPLEAMACGSLLVTSGNEGSMEIVQDYQNGIVCSFEYPMEPAQHVYELVKNADLYQDIVINARRNIEEGFTIEKSYLQIESYIYRASANN